MNEQDAFRIISLIGDKCFDGHYTIMSFTTNYRVSFGSQPDGREEIQKMGVGNSLLEAFMEALKLK